MGWAVNATPRPLYPGAKIPDTHYIGGWVGPRSGMDGCGKSLPPTGIDPRTFRHVSSRYPGPLHLQDIILLWTHRCRFFRNASLYYQSTRRHVAEDHLYILGTRLQSVVLGVVGTWKYKDEMLFNPLTPELNPSAQRCLTKFFTGDFLLEPCISLINAWTTNKYTNYSFSLLIVYGSCYMFRHYIAVFRERS
jgi:hypothetical protein